MSTPAIRALRQSAPGRHITLLGPRAMANAARHIPEVDEAIGYDESTMADSAAALRGFDASVIFTMSGETPRLAATLCQRAGIPLRLAYSREGPDPSLTDWVGEAGAGVNVRHEVQRQLDLVAAVGADTDDERLSFRVRPQASVRARLKLDEAGVDVARPFIVVHPRTGASSGSWPPEQFAAAAARLSTVLDAQIVVTGDAAQRELAERVRRASGDHARSLAGSLTIEEFAAVIELASLIVSSDSGAVHLAAAVGTPVVDLYALADPQHTPWMVPHRVLRKNEGAGVEEVVAATCDLWLDIHWRATA